MRHDLARGEAEGVACAPEGGRVGVLQRRAVPAPLAAGVQRKRPGACNQEGRLSVLCDRCAHINSIRSCTCSHEAAAVVH